MKQELVQKTLDTGLYEYGHHACPLAQKWEPFLMGGVQAEKLLVAYDNADYTFASLPLFTEEKALLLKGLGILREAFGVGQIELYLPESAPEEVKTAWAGEPGLSVVYGKVDVREISDKDLRHHPETVTNIARVQAGQEPMLYAQVAQDEQEKTLCLPLESTVGKFVEAAGFAIAEGAVVAGGYFGRMLAPGQLNQPLYGLSNCRIELYPGSFCAVSFAQKASAHAAAESCGRCTFCREGNYQISRFLKSAVTGHGAEEDTAWLRTLSEAVGEESVCSFGQESVRFLRDALVSESKSFDAHIKGKRCDAGVCQAFTDYAVDGSLCVGCDKCRQACRYGAIEDGPGFIHRIDVFDCTKCGECAAVCPEKAIYRVRVGRLIGPTKATKVGRFRTSRKQY